MKMNPTSICRIIPFVLIFVFGCQDRAFDAQVWRDAKTTDEQRCQMANSLKARLENATRDDVEKWFPKSKTTILVGTCSLFDSSLGTGFYILEIKYRDEKVDRVRLKKS